MNREAQTPEAKKFLADAQAWPWVTFHIVMTNGEFFPPSTDVAVLDAAVRKFGCAGFVGFVHDASTNELAQMLRPYGVPTPEAEQALAAAADTLSPNSVVAGDGKGMD